MRTRKAEMEITYNGAAVTTKLAGYETEISYTDPASGEADALDITMHDRERQWTTAWVPLMGDTMTAAIRTKDWNRQGDTKILPCGFFILDSYEYSGWPVAVNISAVSVPAEGSFRATERTKTWENVTIREIGKEIAKRAGISLAWDVEGEPFTIKSVEQSAQTDCEFLMDLCDAYGLAMKVYSQKIVVYDREAYKRKDPVGKVTEEEITTWSWSKNLTGTYTGGEYTYTDPTTEEEIKATVGAGTRLLKQSGKADSQADAERKIKAAVAKANHGTAKLSLTVMGRPDLVASQCVTVVGLGKLSGKYYIDRAAHHITGSNGYTTDLELSLVETMTEEVIEDATERLAAVGVMNSPSYWVAHYKDVGALGGLILNMATRIKVNLHGASVRTVPAALTVLTNTGVINSPDYWAKKYTAVARLDKLLISAANALTP